MRFEWDEVKNRRNQVKHSVSFQNAQALFTSEVDYLEIFDAEHSHDEDRFICIGPITAGIVVVVVVEAADDVIRIISARGATRREIALYQEWFGERLR